MRLPPAAARGLVMLRTDHPTLQGVRAVEASIVGHCGTCSNAWRIVWRDQTTDEDRAEYVSWKAYRALCRRWRDLSA